MDSAEPTVKLMVITLDQDHLCRITFSAFPTCICVNQLTATHQQIDVVVGFATGDIFWFGRPLIIEASYPIKQQG